MQIKKIPLRDQILLSASVCINSYKRAVEEMVYNSLDASSTSIAVRVNIEENYIQILDNGSGIEKSNFALLGKKYTTSKFIDITTLKSVSDKYGFRGLSLASMIEISQAVNISSKVDNCNETWIKSFYKGKENNITLHTNRPSKGTTVEVTGFLYNLKIQKKSIDPIKELQNIKLYLQQVSLVHCNVSISLRDDCRNEIIFTVNKNRHMYQTLRSLFKIQQNDLHDLLVEKNQYKVRGYIGKNNENTKTYQWIYLNGKIINKSILHKKINNMLYKTINMPGCGNKRNKNVPDENYLFNNNLPHYFIFMSCPNLDFDIIYKNNNNTIVEFKNWKEIERLLEKLIKFYSGDLTLKPIMKKQESNLQQNKKCSETRKKVKEIMEKILNNHAHRPKISQLKKGVKGKNVKRKKEIKFQDITNERNTISKNNLLKKTVDLTKIIDPKNKLTPTCNEKSFKKTNLIKKQSKVKYQKYLDYNASEKNPPLSLNKTKNVVFNKCKGSLNKQKTKVLNYKRYKKFLEYKNSVKNYSQRNDTLKDTMKQNDTAKSVAINNFKIKTSYDLLHPATIFQSFTPLKEEQRFFIQEQSQSYIATWETHFPKTTFDSHHYNKGTEQKKNVMKQFISSNSCKNFLLNEKSFRKRTHMHNSNHLKKFKSILAFSKPILNKNKVTSSKINHFKEMRETPTFYAYSNKMSNIKNIDFEKQYVSQNDVNEKKYTYSVDINYENTYTIDVQSSSLFTYNSNYNKTYSLQTCNNFRNKSLYSLSFLTHNETFHEIVENNSNKNIMISESQPLEPLNFCKSVFQIDKWADFEEKKQVNTSVFNKDQTQEINHLKSTNKPIVEDVSVNNCALNDQPNETNILAVGSHVSDKVPAIDKDLNDANKRHISQDIMIEEIVKSDSVAVECDDKNNFKLKGRHTFVPKGMSQIFKNNYKKECTLDNVQDCYGDEVYKNFAEHVINNLKIFEPEIENVNDVVSKDLKKVNNRLDKENASLIFDSFSLKNAEVIGQVDAKFILALIKGRTSASGTSSNFLALFDQHAVDERVRLESNLKDYLNGNEWASVSLDSVIKLKLSQEDYFYVYNHKEKFYQFGLQWTFANNEILIHGIPTAILGKNMREVEIVIKAVKNLFSELIDIIKSLKGNVSSYPKSIMNLICSEACRYAIKFGDKLSRNNCINMINALSKCNTPFQCAHGRPVMAILMELTNNTTNYKVNLNKIKTMSSLQDKRKIINQISKM